MKFAAALALVGYASANHHNLRDMYAKYLVQHNKNYITEAEFEARFENFAKTHHDIMYHNSKNAGYTLGHNFLSDWTDAEKAVLNGYKAKEMVTDAEVLEFDASNGGIDWRKSLKSVNHVKNQGQCGSCWAFSTTGSIESNTEIATGEVPTWLSEQQLVDCSTQNNGCEGGLYDYAFEYVASNGLEGESDYPYWAMDGTCSFKKDKVRNHKVDSYTPYNDINAGDAETFKARLAKGPVSVAIQANQAVFQQYTGGVIPDDGSCGTQLDHAVLCVGWGNDGGDDYAIVKNSWGSSWGVGGFVKLAFGAGKSFWGGKTSACGFLNQSSQVHVDA